MKLELGHCSYSGGASLKPGLKGGQCWSSLLWHIIVAEWRFNKPYWINNSSHPAFRVLHCHGLRSWISSCPALGLLSGALEVWCLWLQLRLQEVARATTVAFLMYASPSGWGFTFALDQERMELPFNVLKRCGFLPMSAPSASTFPCVADQQLFRAVILDPIHVLHYLLPEVRRVSYY